MIIDAEPDTLELAKPWVIEWRGARLSSDEVTVGHYSAAILVASSDSWDLDPRRTPGNLLAWVIVAVATSTGRDIDDVRDEVAAAPMVELIRAVRTVSG